MNDFEEELIKELRNFYGLMDETVGSWHRFVDAIEEIARKMPEPKDE